MAAVSSSWLCVCLQSHLPFFWGVTEYAPVSFHFARALSQMFLAVCSFNSNFEMILQTMPLANTHSPFSIELSSKKANATAFAFSDVMCSLGILFCLDVKKVCAKTDNHQSVFGFATDQFQ